MSEPKQNAVYSIQLLRGLAALFVVLFHARPMLNDYAGLGDRLFVHGYIGVDIFFIISGFIFQHVTRPTTTPGNFMMRRIIRILPMYLVAVVVLYLALGDYSVRSFFSAVLRTAIFLPNANENPPFFGYAFLSAGWTLIYEMAFYAIFAAALFFSRRFYSVIVCGAIVSLTIIPQLVITGSITLQPDRAPLMPHAYLGVITNPMMLEFVIGVVLAAAYRQKAFTVVLRPAVGIGCIVAAIALVASGAASGHGPVNFGLPALLVTFAALCLEPLVRNHLGGIALAVGAGSYSLYLFHQPAFAMVKPLVDGLPAWGTFVTSIGAAIALAMVAYRLLERPIVHFGRSLSQRNRRPLVFAGE